MGTELTPADLGTPDEPAVVLPSDTPPEPASLPSDGGIEKLLAGKFKDQAALEAGYLELQKLTNKQGEEVGALRKTKEQLANEEATKLKVGALEELATKLLDDGFQESEEFTLKAEQAGVDVRDVKLMAYDKRDNRNKALEVAGGEETFSQISEWAKESLTAPELAQYNAGLASGNTFVIEAVKGRYEKATANVNTEPTIVTGDSGATSSNFYSNLSEYQADKRSKEYQNSNAVKKAVDDKFNRSFKAGKIS